MYITVKLSCRILGGAEDAQPGPFLLKDQDNRLATLLALIVPYGSVTGQVNVLVIRTIVGILEIDLTFNIRCAQSKYKTCASRHLYYKYINLRTIGIQKQAHFLRLTTFKVHNAHFE